MFFSKRPLPGSVPALFLHIQKTAGSSLIEIARRYYGASVTSHGDCWGREASDLSNVGFISGHIGYHYARPLMSGRYSFTFLRHPGERILSMYYFCKSRDPGEFEIYRRAHNMDLVGFLRAGFTDPWVRKNIWNNQVWQLAHGYAHRDERRIDDFSEDELLHLAQEHLGEFSHVGFTESFAVDTVPILKALGLPPMKTVPTANVGPARLAFADQPSEVRELLDRLTVLDRQLYEYARHGLVRARRDRWWLR